MKKFFRMICFITITVLSLIVLSALEIRVSAATTYTEKYTEFRGVWVATVSNIDITQQSSDSEDAIKSYKNTYLNILKNCAKFNINVIVFQVRPLNDAFWKSDYAPWSRYLIGTEGKDPGWDPLEWMVSVTHEAGMEFHAWMNPYRASNDVLPETGDYQDELNAYLDKLPDNNWAKNHRDCLVRGDAKILLNPAREEVREYLINIIEEITTNYDIDAVHFDDYFYNGVLQSEDAADYNAYKAQGGTLSKADWRREQVNLLIEGIHDKITYLNQTLNKHVQFGISPCCVWAASKSYNPGNTSDYVQEGGMDVSAGSYSAYADLYADTRKWVQENWIDYIIPQNYGKIDDWNHKVCTEWWAKVCQEAGVKCYIGLAIYRFSQGWSSDEVDNQMQIGYDNNVDGFCFFSYRNLITPVNTNHKTCLSLIQGRFSHLAQTPIITGGNVVENSSPTLSITRQNNKTILTISGGSNVFCYRVWRYTNLEIPTVESKDILHIVKSYNKDIVITDTADNDTGYRYCVEPYYYDGTRSDVVDKSVRLFKNNKPNIPEVYYDTFALHHTNNTNFKLYGYVSDPDGDTLNVTIYHINNETADVIRTIKLTGVSGYFEVTVPISRVLTGESYFRITVNDGSASRYKETAMLYYYSDSDEVAALAPSNMIYSGLSHFNQSVDAILDE